MESQILRFRQALRFHRLRVGPLRSAHGRLLAYDRESDARSIIGWQLSDLRNQTLKYVLAATVPHWVRMWRWLLSLCNVGNIGYPALVRVTVKYITTTHLYTFIHEGIASKENNKIQLFL
jgi:hypothetical protein